MSRVPLLIIVALVAATTLRATAQQPVVNTIREGSVVGRTLAVARTEVVSTIQGNALTSTNGILANAPLRLRDARSGRIVDNSITDKTGLFSFRGVEPGSYVVELVGDDQSVLAASQILNVNAGDAISAIVKLPFKVPPFGGIFGHSIASVVAVTATAAASGVLATEISGNPESPRQ